MFEMKEIKVRITTFEGLLGTASADPEIHREYIASKAPVPENKDEEVEAIDPDEVFEKSMTVFPRVDGKPIIWDYQLKGFFKDTCGALRKISTTESAKIKAFKKEIDGLIFIKERSIPIQYDGEIAICQRPLRASTAQGERIALSSSEEIPAGAVIEFTILYQLPQHGKAIREWLDYGVYRGLGQWRNSGKGRFYWEELSDSGKVIGGTMPRKAG